MMRGLHPSNAGELPVTRNMPFSTKTMPSKSHNRNMTGIYLGLEGNIKPPNSRALNVPVIARGRGMSQRIRTPTEQRRYKMVEQLRIKEEKRGFVGQPLKSAKRTHSAHDQEERRKAVGAPESLPPGDLSPRSFGARKWGPGKTVDRNQFYDLIKTNPRNYTVVVNNGVTRSENLSGMMSFSLDQSEATPQMVETLTEEVNRISAKEEEAIGLEECFKKVCKGNVESLQSLFPYRKQHPGIQREHSQYSTGFTVRSYRNPNQAEIMANFSEGNAQRPRTVPADSMHNRPIVPSPYFFRQYNNPYNKLTNNSSSSAKSRKSAPSQLQFDGQLSSVPGTSRMAALPGAGALSRSLKSRSAAWSESDFKLHGKLHGTPREVLPKPDENSVMETVIKGATIKGNTSSKGGKQVQISMKLSSGQDSGTSPEQSGNKMMDTVEKTPKEKKDGFEIEVADEHGKAGQVEIDSPEEELQEATPIKGNVRKTSISEKVEKTRLSQAYIETIKENAEKRRKQFEQMLDEHAEIVQEIGRAGSREGLQEDQRDH
ncbi:uncharacterized protein LOC111129131 isoform X1 [Crassostrea virginica]|uniref:Uncharacterized protein LOC111129131 isoform X1 n=1 Tax=Crassostrea virginica TaxID=6565 RepID=A0A8B8DRV3_CRAVI|nr:uncharacterized protein LOC111129131 isoform X1 [Crassostrea virginica]XP_022330977.1 uncharacterized protein LOC111129131 isoform X1 [Crassostrea virginica]XP_022330978.1 uncharacterized protein LOC111129131 isoform X1 [Crassostrea virginica]